MTRALYSMQRALYSIKRAPISSEMSSVFCESPSPHIFSCTCIQISLHEVAHIQLYTYTHIFDTNPHISLHEPTFTPGYLTNRVPVPGDTPPPPPLSLGTCTWTKSCKQVGYTGWRRLIGCLKLQVIFCKRSNNYRALLRKMAYKDEASYDSTPPCRGNGTWRGPSILWKPPIFYETSPNSAKSTLYSMKRALILWKKPCILCKEP